MVVARTGIPFHPIPSHPFAILDCFLGCPEPYPCKRGGTEELYSTVWCRTVQCGAAQYRAVVPTCRACLLLTVPLRGSTDGGTISKHIAGWLVAPWHHMCNSVTSASELSRPSRPVIAHRRSRKEVRQPMLSFCGTQSRRSVASFHQHSLSVKVHYNGRAPSHLPMPLSTLRPVCAGDVFCFVFVSFCFWNKQTKNEITRNLKVYV